MPEVTLSDDERAALAALLAVILPSTSGPGATEAGAVDYVTARLPRESPELVAALRTHLPAAAGDPDATVAALAADPATPDFQVFRRLRQWAWEGFLCEPKHGGNRDQVGWTRFGITGPPQPRGFTPAELAIVEEGSTS